MIYVEVGLGVIDALQLSFLLGDFVIEIKLNIECMWY